MTSRIEKLQAMAADTSSPHEAKIARAKLNEMQGKASEALKRFAEDGRNRYANIDIKNMFYLRDSLNGTINIKMSSGSGGVGGFGGSYTGYTGNTGSSGMDYFTPLQHDSVFDD